MSEVNQHSFYQVYDYEEYDLLEQPDIYLIFIESYGGVLYDRPYLEKKYRSLLDELEGELAAEGWHAVSTLSESPSWGGGSWMAYTSALFGLRITSHPAYLALMERFANGGYPHLGETLKKMGYFNGRVTSLAVELDDSKWDLYRSFFGTDSWLHYGDLNYDGAHYGWGPAPPDQFTLSFANETLHSEALQNEAQKPLFLFMITQNSHYPWPEVPPLVEDWRSLNDGSDANPTRNLATPKVSASFEDYFDIIEYELQFLMQFILEEADPNAIIILAGDHQPGYITHKADGYETPLHIISRDEVLLNNLQAYGLKSGLSVEESQSQMRHEGFYSLLMRALIERYGRGDLPLPPYLPDGLEIDTHNQ